MAVPMVSLVAEEANAQLTDQIHNKLKSFLSWLCLEDTGIYSLKLGVLASASRFSSFLRIPKILEVNVADTGGLQAFAESRLRKSWSTRLGAVANVDNHLNARHLKRADEIVQLRAFVSYRCEHGSRSPLTISCLWTD
jgi:hypothetical protein